MGSSSELIYLQRSSKDYQCNYDNEGVVGIVLSYSNVYSNIKTLLKCMLIKQSVSNNYELISKHNVGLKTLLSEGLSEPEFYGDLVYKFKKLIGSNDFSFQFRKIITRYRRIGYNLNVMRQSACLVFYPIMVDNYAAFFNCTPVGRASDYDGPNLKLFILVGWGRSFLSVAWPTGVQLMFFFSSGVSKLFGAQGSPSSGSLLNL